MLTWFFLFFLLKQWNYPADNKARAFCRIWIPSVLTLIVGLLLPVGAELAPKHSTVWDVMGGLVNGGGILALVVWVWLWPNKPVSSARVRVVFGVSTVLLVSFIFIHLMLFYVACFIAITVFCVFVCNDFRDDLSDSEPKPWSKVTSAIGLGFAILFAGAILLLSASSVPWRMFVGAPTFMVCGFSFLIALVFLLTAVLSLVSPVLVRLGWVLMVILVLIAPLNHEPLRVLTAASKPQPRLPPSAHFVEWLRARPEVLEGTKPYPVFFIAAEGGGARAAYWTSTLLAGLEERYPGFTEHIYAISGVFRGQRRQHHFQQHVSRFASTAAIRGVRRWLLPASAGFELVRHTSSSGTFLVRRFPACS